MSTSWESRFRRFLDNKLKDGERMWNSIQNGPYQRPTIPNPDNTQQQILEPLSKMTEGNKKQYIADVRVMNYLLQAIPNDICNISYFQMSEAVTFPPTIISYYTKDPNDQESENYLGPIEDAQYIAITDHVLWDIITNGDQSTTDPLQPVSNQKLHFAATAMKKQ
ncbi:hypothetical protein Tco_1164348 [Tanacetum coccineum]